MKHTNISLVLAWVFTLCALVLPFVSTPALAYGHGGGGAHFGGGGAHFGGGGAHFGGGGAFRGYGGGAHFVGGGAFRGHGGGAHFVGGGAFRGSVGGGAHFVGGGAFRGSVGGGANYRWSGDRNNYRWGGGGWGEAYWGYNRGCHGRFPWWQFLPGGYWNPFFPPYGYGVAGGYYWNDPCGRNIYCTPGGYRLYRDQFGCTVYVDIYGRCYLDSQGTRVYRDQYGRCVFIDAYGNAYVQDGGMGAGGGMYGGYTDPYRSTRPWEPVVPVRTYPQPQPAPSSPTTVMIIIINNNSNNTYNYNR